MRKKKTAHRKRGPKERAARPGLGRRVLRTAPLMFLLIILVIAFGRLGVLHKFETMALDTETRLNPVPAESEVAIVNIVDADYEHLFESKSPLQPDRLHGLIDAIASAQPAVIGVDIDTSDKQFREGFPIPSSWPPIVWMRIIKELPESVNEKPEPVSVMGGRDAALDRDAGLALLIEDSEDKVTRRYSRFIDTAEGPLPSFPWAVVHKFAPEKTLALDDRAGPLLIRYSGDREGKYRVELTAARLLELAPGWKNSPQASPLHKKIVLLGGSYLGQDRHDTPLGKMEGVKILASVIETELRGGGYGPPNKLTIALLEIFDGFFLILLFHLLRPLKALLISLLATPVLALACSLISFVSFSRWAYFAPVLLGVLAFELYDDYRRKWIPRMYEDITQTKSEV